MTLEYGKTYNRLASSALFGFFLEEDIKARERIIGELIEHGEKAIKFLSTFCTSYELAKVFAKKANYIVLPYIFNTLEVSIKTIVIRQRTLVVR